jgi:hypothetical protein
MSALVTLDAIFEFAQHLLAVGRIMATLAVRYNAMFVGMTEYTLEFSMFCQTGLKVCPDIRVTCGTIRVGNSF